MSCCSCEDFNYIYLLQEREFIKSNENVYKVGKTKQTIQKRLKNYAKGSKLLFFMECNNCDIMEKEILKLFKEKFKLRAEFGTEHFEGNKNEMIKILFDKIYEDILTNNNCKNNEVTKNDNVNNNEVTKNENVNKNEITKNDNINNTLSKNVKVEIEKNEKIKVIKSLINILDNKNKIKQDKIQNNKLIENEVQDIDNVDNIQCEIFETIYVNNIKRFKCPCGKTFQRKLFLHNHQNGKIGCSEYDKKIIEKQNKIEEEINEKRVLICKLCNNNYSTKSSLNRHLKICENKKINNMTDITNLILKIIE